MSSKKLGVFTVQILSELTEEIDMKSWIADIVDEELVSQLFFYESNDDFIQRVCEICITEIENAKGYSPAGYGADVLAEIERQVTEVFKIKTYGHYNLQEYRKSLLLKRVCSMSK